MNAIKQFALIEFGVSTTDDKMKPSLSLGEITGPYYNREIPDFIFDTEEEAIQAAYKRCPYSNYLILPHISFRD